MTFMILHSIWISEQWTESNCRGHGKHESQDLIISKLLAVVAHPRVNTTCWQIHRPHTLEFFPTEEGTTPQSIKFSPRTDLL